MDFLYSYIVLAEIYVLLGLSTNLLVGIVGIFSVSPGRGVRRRRLYRRAFHDGADPLSFLPSMAIAAVVLRGAEHIGHAASRCACPATTSW